MDYSWYNNVVLFFFIRVWIKVCTYFYENHTYLPGVYEITIYCVCVSGTLLLLDVDGWVLGS